MTISKYLVFLIVANNMLHQDLASVAACPLPQDTTNLILKDIVRGRLIQGNEVAVNSFVEFACVPGYTLEGSTRLYCGSNGWSKMLPTCHKYCSKSGVHGITTKVVCSYMNAKVNCDDRLRPGTVASITCATFFTPPKEYSGKIFHKTLTCTEEGTWDLEKPKCIMNCGVIQPETTAFIKQGTDMNITKVPWHVGIYNKFDGERYEHICGGTIISPKIVLSAAHCFWDSANSKIFDKSFYSVAAGKYYRNYYKAKDVNTQKRSIEKIIVHPNYRDVHELYLHDMAILTLVHHLEFSAFIRPICVSGRKDFEKFVKSNETGFIAGWGISDDNSPSEVLKSVRMTTLSHDDCNQNLPVDYDLPEDKFCIQNEFGGTACRGDSGSGFFTRHSTDYGANAKYFLEGVVSHSPEKTADCAKNGVVALTGIRIDEIKQLIIQDQRYNHIELHIQEYCSKDAVLGISTRAVCSYKNLTVDCDDRMRPGTVASISCATFFSPPKEHSGGIFRKALTCTDEGTWDLDRPRCIMNCGVVQPKTTALIRLGIDAEVTDVPWHATIFKLDIDSLRYICGGSIISPSIVVSAAHCFWDRDNSKIYDKSIYRVVPAKYFTDLGVLEEISKIVIPENYNDASSFFLNDVAVVILVNPFVFNAFVRPICMHFRPGFTGYMQSNVLGSIVGWDTNEDNTQSPRLSRLNMKTLSHADCKPGLPKYYDLPDDKFCVLNELGGNACLGDSGGGFFTKQSSDGGRKSFFNLEGVISSAASFKKSCADGNLPLTGLQVDEIKSLIKAEMLDDQRKF